MSTKPVIPIKIVESFFDRQEAVDERIRLRAYEHFIRRGQTPGHELDDWRMASTELIQCPRVTVGQTETQFVVLFSVPDVNVKLLELLVTERAILLQSAPHPLSEVPGYIHLCELPPRRVFRVVELPSSFNPSAIAVEYDAGFLRASLGMRATTPTAKATKVPKPRATKTRSAAQAQL